jgi:hypothetical protein
MDPGVLPGWGASWAWGLPIIVLTVVFHAYGLGLLNERVSWRLSARSRFRYPTAATNFLIGLTALSATALHAGEGAIWACAYRILGASPDNRAAMLYSLNALTSYGHADIHLAPHWQMMGSLEALNGWILFGLTTAFLFTVIQKAWHTPDR